MLIPNSFTQAISNAFYDKTATILSSGVETDAEGYAFVGVEADSYPTTFACNTEFNADRETLQEYGFTKTVSLIVTTSTSVDVQLGAVIEINSEKYRVDEVIVNDSHKLLGCTAWLLKSLTSISA